MDPPSRVVVAPHSPLDQADVYTKFMMYSLALFVVPIFTYHASQEIVLPAVFHRFPHLTMIATPGARSVASGVLAVVCVNVILISFVLSALTEGRVQPLSRNTRDLAKEK